MGKFRKTLDDLLYSLHTVHTRPDTTAASIQSRYGRLLVAVSQVRLPHGAMVHVESMDDLARLAVKGRRMVLHVKDGYGDHYLVQDGSTTYRYSIGAAETKAILETVDAPSLAG